MEEKQNSRNRFDNAADTWDHNPRQVDLARQILKSLMDAIPFQKHWNTMEIGCGTGLLTCPVAGKVASLTAVDTSQGMLDALEAKVREHGITNIRTVASDIFTAPSAYRQDGQYALIFSSMTFHHIGNTREALQRLHTLLLPEGYLAIADLDEEDGSFHDNQDTNVYHGFNRKALQNLFAQCGFSGISFSNAASIKKVNRAGKEKTYTVFLVVARKPIRQ